MTDGDALTVDGRILSLLNHLGIERAHFAGLLPSDWAGLVTQYPDCVSSLSLVCPRNIDPNHVINISNRLLVVTGDHGPTTENLQNGMSGLPDARLVSLQDYSVPAWSDVIADRTQEIGDAMLAFLGEIDPPDTHAHVSDNESEGQFAGVSYRIQGQGPPLILLPQGMAPSQWEPLLSRLSEHYQTVTLGGPHLGMVAILEARGRAAGYLQMMSALVDSIGVRPGQTILEVGCGTGVLDRWLCRQTGGANPMTGLDLNPYLLREAATFANAEGLSDTISFREGNAEALPFPDESFDASFSVTVIEECDADKHLAEMVRVTKPGGKVAIVARATDIPYVRNVQLAEQLKSKVQAAPGPVSVAPNGCADASLYQRFVTAGLSGLQMFPHFSTFDRSDLEILQAMENPLLSTLSQEEVQL